MREMKELRKERASDIAKKGRTDRREGRKETGGKRG